MDSVVKQYSKRILLVVGSLALAWSFWTSAGWLQLCAGLALFLFGMQCLEEGLRELAGGKLEHWLKRSTSTPFKGLLFGTGATFVLQSSTLVSLLTIAFLSTGLIQLAGGIAVLFGANLGATSGIWLLALAGQNLSLSPLALPLLVFGILASFNGAKSKAAGRIVLGIAFIFLGIDQLKEGFTSFGDALDMTAYQAQGLGGQLVFVGIGLALTVVLQSSHATLMLILAALAGAQLGLDQALALAIGSNVGSSVSTAFVGFLGGNRSGQRLALAHVVFNSLTAIVAIVLLAPLTWLVIWLTGLFGLGSNSLIQLALFHSLFNATGVLMFWPWQAQLANLLCRLLPEQAEPHVLIAEVEPQLPTPTRARYLVDSALDSVDAAASAVAQELQHLERLSLEVICHALYLPIDQLDGPHIDEALLQARTDKQGLDAETLYQRHIKGVYGDLLSFMGRLDLNLDEAQQQFWLGSQVAALQLVDAVKDAKHLQKNLGRQLEAPDSALRRRYVELRRHLLLCLREVRELNRSALPDALWSERLQLLDEQAAGFDAGFRQRLFASVRAGELDGLQTSSLMNDLGYCSRIIQSLRNVLLLGEGHELSRQLREVLPQEEAPLIHLR
jgi:phosphate:Na+ symporter